MGFHTAHPAQMTFHINDYQIIAWLALNVSGSDKGSLFSVYTNWKDEINDAYFKGEASS